MVRILVVDDEAEIVRLLRDYFEINGYEVLTAQSGQEAIARCEQQPDLILLDIGLPDLDGLTVCTRIRQHVNCPILFLTARIEQADQIVGFAAGADDYIVKPFNPLELVARVKSQLRRYVTFSGSFGERDDVLQCDGLVINNTTKEVLVDGEPVRLTPIEYKILHLLMQNQGRVFSIDEIYEKVWNEPSFNAENTVAVHIRRIREKIEFDPKKPKYLKVVWGLGYKIEKL